MLGSGLAEFGYSGQWPWIEWTGIFQSSQNTSEFLTEELYEFNSQKADNYTVRKSKHLLQVTFSTYNTITLGGALITECDPCQNIGGHVTPFPQVYAYGQESNL